MGMKPPAAFVADTQAFEAFYLSHLRAVERFVARRVTDPQEAADLTADVFVAVIERSHTYDPRRGPASAWLYGVARNVVAEHGRRRARSLQAVSRVRGRALVDADSLSRIEERIDAERQAAGVLEAIADLPDDERAILELVAVDELTVTDAAVALGVKPGTARVRLHRARRRLARLAPAVPQPSNPALEEALT